MPLTGTYQRSLVDKSRVAIPKRLQEDFDEGNLKEVYLAPGTDRSLVMYGPGGFAKLADRFVHNSQGASYLRIFYANAERVELDSQGRIRIPERLLKYAGLTESVAILGVQDRVELWDWAAWEISDLCRSPYSIS